MLTRLAHAPAAVDGVHAREPAHAEAVSISADRVIVRVRFWHHPLKATPVTSAVAMALAGAIESAGYIGIVTSHPGVPPLTPPDRQ